MMPIIDYSTAVSKNKLFIFLSPAQVAVPHTHNFLELAYILSGKCEHTMDGQTCILSKGDYILLDKTCSHSYNVIGDEELSIVNCLFFPSFIEYSISDEADIYTILENYHFKFKREFFIQNPIGTVFKDVTGDIKNLLVVMNNEFINKNANYLELIRGCLIQLLITTMRSIYTDIKISTDDNTVQNILEYINLNYMHDITLKEICNKYNYSLPYMSARFKKSVGIPFMEYLQKIRIENSMKLLSDTSQPIADIAAAVGYKDIKSYYRIFKRYTNTTPAQFKKSNMKFDPDKYIFVRRKYKKIQNNRST